ncbi:U3 small nucleolar ribonucleoprotein protein IMP3-like [Miscanthus floridulus]|uniref:U3 small nucleolar ribonucleoprotein protein IMP3-like n=1 Tax=Miscanthus floridulus TaxID=154761 RepID=UPI0034584830
MRKLKFHEQKLLKRTNFLEYKREGGHREALITQRYGLVERDDYKKYNGICLMVQKLVNIIKQMDLRDPFRIEMTDMLLDKLYNMGVISTKESLIKCEKLSVSAFCRSPPPSLSLLPRVFVFLCRMLHSIGHLTSVQVFFLD